MVSSTPAFRLVRGLAAAAVLTIMVDTSPAQPTSIDEIVMYAIDNSSHELLRYEFGFDTAEAIDMIHLADGSVLTDLKSLAYIPGRLDLYSVWNGAKGGATLVRIDMFTGEAQLAPAPIGFENVEGLVSIGSGGGDDANRGHGNDCDGYDEDNPGKGKGVNENGMRKRDGNCSLFLGVTWQRIGYGDYYRLVSINPDTGEGTLVMDLSRRYEGLAATIDGSLLGASGSRLYLIDMEAKTETLVGGHRFRSICGLEYAYGNGSSSPVGQGCDADCVCCQGIGECPTGCDYRHDLRDDICDDDEDLNGEDEDDCGYFDYDLAIEVPDVDPDFWRDGILFGFSDRNNTMVLINRRTGDAVSRRSSVGSAGLQGIVFLVESLDPLSSMTAGIID